jgi:hypothetical protein
MPAALPYKKAIANKVRRMIRDGVTVRDILASIQDFQDAPSSMATFYKTYGMDIAQERSEIVGMIGNKVVQQAMEGDFKSQELYLRSKGGWSPNSTVNENEQEVDADMDESAIDALMTLLGKNPSTEGEPDPS